MRASCSLPSGKSALYGNTRWRIPAKSQIALLVALVAKVSQAHLRDTIAIAMRKLIVEGHAILSTPGAVPAPHSCPTVQPRLKLPDERGGRTAAGSAGRRQGCGGVPARICNLQSLFIQGATRPDQGIRSRPG